MSDRFLQDGVLLRNPRILFGVLVCLTPLLWFGTCMKCARIPLQACCEEGSASYQPEFSAHFDLLQQDTPTQTHTVTPSSTISATTTTSPTPSVSPTLSTTPGTETITATLTPTGTITETITVTQSPALTASSSPTSPLFTVTTPSPSETPDAALTASETDASSPQETPPGTPTLTPTLIPFPKIKIELPTSTKRPVLYALEHPAGTPVIPKNKVSGISRWIRFWPLMLIIGIWVILIVWYSAVHFLDQKYSAKD